MSWSPQMPELAGPLIVACSGGADSTALAHWIAAEHAAGRAGAPILAYVDHQLRADSASDGARVRALAERLGAAFATVEVTVDGGASLERAARDARLAALERIADDRGARWIALAHTASDQAETVLLRVLRGTGVAGLGAMAPVRDRFVRPLLGCRRADTEAYCRAHDLAWVDDPMNDDPRFARVRIRHQILPALAAENPAIEAALCRLAEAARDQREVLDAAAQSLLGDPGAGLEVARLVAAPRAAARRALVLAAAAAGLGSLEAAHIEAVDRLLRQPCRGTVTLDLPGGVARREYDRLIFEAQGRGAPAPGPLSVAGHGGPFAVRPWRPGDRMRPRRLRGRSRKLGDLFSDAKVPRRLREGARVVVREGDGEIVWAEHIGPAHGSDLTVSLTTPKPVTTNEN